MHWVLQIGGLVPLIALASCDRPPMSFIQLRPQGRPAFLARATRTAKDAQKTAAVPSLEELQQIQSVAEEAARAAGRMILSKVGASVKDTKLNTKDLVTEVDAAAQEIIEGYVRDRFPSHGVLGEESVPPGRKESEKALQEILGKYEVCWIVDPIDGTINFVHGQTLSTVSIGVAFQSEVLIGVIYDPFLDEMFTTIKGQGAYRNGARINVGSEATLHEAVVATGSPPAPRNLAPMLRGIVGIAPLCRTLRALGSAAIMYAWVACGRLTSYFEVDLNSWDHAAGVLLVTEAGGRVTDIDGSPYTIATRAIVASNGLTHNETRQALVDADCIRTDPA